MSAKTTTDELSVLLRKLFPAPAWAYIPEFASGTGRYYSRKADAIAFSLYPSRGLEWTRAAITNLETEE